MRWKIQLYRIIYAHALENTVISYYLRTCAGKYSNIALFTLLRWKIQLYHIIYAHALENTVI
jgi:hypothetical protein